MKKYYYLTYLKSPYNSEVETRLYIRGPEQELLPIVWSDLSSYENIVSYNVEELFSYPSKELSHHIDIIDVCQVARLLQGKPHKGRRGKEPWNIWYLVNQNLGQSPEIDWLWNAIYENGLDKSNKTNIINSMRLLSFSLESIWSSMREKLKVKGEDQRYFQIEKPVNSIFISQQSKGIHISPSKLSFRLNVVDEQLADSARKLRLTWGIRNPDDRADVLEKLKGVGLWQLASSMQYSYDRLLDLYVDGHDLPSILKSYYDLKRDKQILLRLGGIGTRRIFPVYQTLGTVTGRIMVQSPELQHLRRSNRDIIVPEQGKKFLYPDYAQFEPGILADDTKDKQLISDFNSGDLYTTLSIELFGDQAKRKSAKILFLSFCYGMKLSTIAKIAAESSGKSLIEVETVINHFFGRYRALSSWLRNLELTLIHEGKIGTRQGNFRYRESSGNVISSEEKRWMISQRIQGTAALIFKRVVIEVNKKIPNTDIILPMHDALLLQVPEDREKEVRVSISGIFIEQFRKECPSIVPRVSYDDFFSGS